jgi:hypothetical protein
MDASAGDLAEIFGLELDPAAHSSCAGLSRTSTSLGVAVRQDVDGRDEPGHDAEGVIVPAAALGELLAIYTGSDGEATKALYARLEPLGPAGIVAVNLFRACKASERAKKYRGGERGRGSFKAIAYEKKEFSIDNLCQVLDEHAAALGVHWGWGFDDKQPYHRHVIYVEIPTGQVSFHTSFRRLGPNFDGKWDGIVGVAPQRICGWIAVLLGAAGDGGAL